MVGERALLPTDFYDSDGLMMIALGINSVTFGTRGFFEAWDWRSILCLSISAGVGDLALDRNASGTTGTLGFFAGFSSTIYESRDV